MFEQLIDRDIKKVDSQRHCLKSLKEQAGETVIKTAFSKSHSPMNTFYWSLAKQIATIFVAWFLKQSFINSQLN